MRWAENKIADAERSRGRQGCFAAYSWALAIYIAVLPLMRWTLLERFDSTAIVADAAFLAASVVFVAALLRGELTWRPSGVYLALGCYAGALLLSTFAATDPRASAGKLVVEAYLLTITILTFNVVRSDRALKLV